MADENKEVAAPAPGLPAWLIEVLAILEAVLKVIPATSTENEAARGVVAQQIADLKARSTVK